MSSEISDADYIRAAEKFIGREIRRKNGFATVSVWFDVTDGTDGGEYQDSEIKIPDEEALAAQAEMDREAEVSDAEALDLFRSMKEVESANLGPDGCGLGMMATLWLKAKKANICVALEEGGQKSFADAEIAQLREQVAKLREQVAKLQANYDDACAVNERYLKQSVVDMEHLASLIDKQNEAKIVKLQAMIERVRGR